MGGHYYGNPQTCEGCITLKARLKEVEGRLAREKHDLRWRSEYLLAKHRAEEAEKERDAALEAASINATNLHEVREDLLAENSQLREQASELVEERNELMARCASMVQAIHCLSCKHDCKSKHAGCPAWTPAKGVMEKIARAALEDSEGRG